MADLSYYQNYAFATGGLYVDTTTVTGFNSTGAITEVSHFTVSFQ